MSKTFLPIFCIYIMSLTTFATTSHATDQHESREQPELTRQYKMRCTRRYSPGVCANHVSPVWTYVFQEQNCTERLGCANYFRSNRFKTYSICMKQCQGLIEVYLQMLEMDANNKHQNRNTDLRTKLNPKEPLMGMEVPKPGAKVTSSEDSEDSYEDEDYDQGIESYSIVYKDLMHNSDIFPPDVDRVEGVIRSQYDLLHP